MIKTKGIILEANIGINQEKELVLMLMIVDKDGYRSFHQYKGDKIIKILDSMKGYKKTNTVKKLEHTDIDILDKKGSLKPLAISAPAQDDWIKEDRMEKYFKERIQI